MRHFLKDFVHGACGMLLGICCLASTALGSTPDEEAIRATLARWTADFNTARVDRICGLFAAELRYDYREFPERGYKEICDLLHRSLSDPARQFSYALDIKEIIVAGDLAVVRLIWTLTVTPRDRSKPQSSEEYGMDVFRKQPDGSWKIIRYIAYEAP